ncbi:hypothetical protein Tco_0801970 [Tanacetum coccineum]|uniref:Uncharacterized protein n=1 Tax=Tanacetum coccineum TaxID=301880 RepID=A0ABQ5A124_9ASTR
MSSRLEAIIRIIDFGLQIKIEIKAILASSSEVPSVLEFLQRRKLEAKKEVAASEFSHRPVSVKPDISKPDISKASSTGGKLHILKPSFERNGITPTPKESLSPTSGSKVPYSPLIGESNLSFNSLWSQDVRGDPDSGIGGHWRSSDSGMYKFILILRALAVFRFRRALAVFRFRHAFTKNGIACIYLEGPPHHDFSLMDILPGKSTSQNRRDVPRDNPLVSVEFLRYDIKRSKSKNKGIVPTEMELVLEQTQQGTSYEVSVSTKGVEE